MDAKGLGAQTIPEHNIMHVLQNINNYRPIAKLCNSVVPCVML